MFVCHVCFFFFVSRWNRAIFGPSVLHDPIYKTLFLHFGFTSPNAQNLLPKICTKSPITRLLWQIDRRCLGLLKGFRGWPIQWNHAKCCGADPCCHGNEIWPSRGDLVDYRLVSFFLSSFLCFFVSKITRKLLDRFAWKFQGRCGVTYHGTTWLHFWPILRNRAMPRSATQGRGLLCFRTTACSLLLVASINPHTDTQRYKM